MNENDIAIVGMTCRFPGADNLEQFWHNLSGGVESITYFDTDQLQQAGVTDTLLSNSRYVRARGVMGEAESFDATFFGFTPRDAAIADPQLRAFMECAWHALEHSGHDPARFPGRIGIFAGAHMNTYIQRLYAQPELLATIGGLHARILNDKDFLTTWASYKLNLTGPSVAVQTACSTSLVAVHLACQSLLNGDSALALAGGVGIRTPEQTGYLHVDGGIDSPDGHCRPFDAEAAGTLSGNGVGLIVLRRLKDAIRDRDCIYAVIKGSAINNDGAGKVGFTAPSVEGQVEVISEALAVADVEPATIQYIEAHGTGTPLGDAIELAALKQVFEGVAANSCALGSVKSNIGHLDAAAGIAGLIKTVLALRHQAIPPSLHFHYAHPDSGLHGSPFRVATALTPWTRPAETLRRAGVSAFGVGGTNAHIVLEEAPQIPSMPRAHDRDWNLLVLSAKTVTALDIASENVAAHLERSQPEHLTDVAYTLAVGRQAFKHRRIVVSRSHTEAVHTLRASHATSMSTAISPHTPRPVAFLFPGQGSQYVEMGRDLYDAEPTFRLHLDTVAESMRRANFDLIAHLYPAAKDEQATARLTETDVAQPTLFAVSYALAKTLMDWGIQPSAMLGHSVGEYAAACISGVLGLNDACALVVARGRAVQEAPRGVMMAVALAPESVRPLLTAGLDFAAINAPDLCVISGVADQVQAVQQQLSARGVACHMLKTSHAFHSELLDPVLPKFAKALHTIKFGEIGIPYLSNVTGTWQTSTGACDPRYWTRHLREPVQFASCVQELLRQPDIMLVEVGPGQILTGLAMRHPDAMRHVLLPAMRRADDQRTDIQRLLETLGQLWLGGAPIDWEAYYQAAMPARVSLPVYPFERRKYVLEEVHYPATSSAPDTFKVTDAPDEAAGANKVTVQTVCDVWKEIFGVPQVRPDDDFFDLGGNSLLAIQVTSRMSALLNVRIPLASLFEASTPALQADMLGGIPQQQSDDEVLAELLGEIESTPPFS